MSLHPLVLLIVVQSGTIWCQDAMVVGQSTGGVVADQLQVQSISEEHDGAMVRLRLKSNSSQVLYQNTTLAGWDCYSVEGKPFLLLIDAQKLKRIAIDADGSPGQVEVLATLAPGDRDPLALADGSVIFLSDRATIAWPWSQTWVLQPYRWMPNGLCYRLGIFPGGVSALRREEDSTISFLAPLWDPAQTAKPIPVPWNMNADGTQAFPRFDGTQQKSGLVLASLATIAANQEIGDPGERQIKPLPANRPKRSDPTDPFATIYVPTSKGSQLQITRLDPPAFLPKNVERNLVSWYQGAELLNVATNDASMTAVQVPAGELLWIQVRSESTAPWTMTLSLQAGEHRSLFAQVPAQRDAPLPPPLTVGIPPRRSIPLPETLSTEEKNLAKSAATRREQAVEHERRNRQDHLLYLVSTQNH